KDYLTPMQKLLLTLRFYSIGNFLITVGDFIGVSKMTASRVVQQVSDAIASLRPKYIKFPKTLDELKEVSTNFYTISKFPRCCGAIDCTHVKIRCPVGSIGEVFRNRKGYFSINVQTIADRNLKVLDIVARWPGSTHDSTIFNNSSIKTFLESDGFKNVHIVADKGYGLRTYCLTPISSPSTESEILYNKSIIRTRNVVERKYGVMKRRFPVLALGMALKTSTVMNVIVACSVLHNIAIDVNEILPNISSDIIEAVENDIECNKHFDVDIHAQLNDRLVRTQQD
ncbi:putative nuclease HARBI1, partial [Lucilia sericata]|uniref:putative nuclease HARBI1 n=1 Tax=Lucilia sericata TaxID=13632 RepID=UPI0018A7EE7A